jgi:sulfhydrogenase subunit beta (sulfur reductase)
MGAHFISEGDFVRLLDHLEDRGRVFIAGPVEESETVALRLRRENEAFKYAGFRATQSLKPFLFVAKEKVAEYPLPMGSETLPVVEPVTVVGAAACDITALKTLDAVFMSEDATDCFYAERRENTLIISIECTAPRDTCFCTLLGNKPYPEEGFDLNLAKVDGGFVVETGSEKGESIVNEQTGLFREAASQTVAARDKAREASLQKVQEINRNLELSKARQEILKQAPENPEWFPHVKTCIECAACLFTCPTCHCFLLYDQQGAEKFERLKVWDGCVYAGYSRMAGGGTPRALLVERFRHRYTHKFDQIVERHSIEGCSGCGRCIEACPGNIDLREVFKALDSTVSA